MLSIAFHTLGCKLNFAESSHLLRMFVNDGFVEKSFQDKADVYVINSCTVTSIAEKKCKTAIHQAHKINPNAVIAVIGCFSQINAQELANIEGVDILLGNDNKNQLLKQVKSYLNTKKRINAVVDINAVNNFTPSISFDDRTRGFLKIQDGCDYFCTYCEIPFARGRSRSCSIKDAISYAQILEKENKKEVVLTGVNIGDFGKHNNEKFIDLIRTLDNKTNIPRYRISSIEPDLLTKDIIDFCASSRAFLPHFHIPLQSGSNTVLKAMNRHYTIEEFRDKVFYILSLMPNAFIAIDCMTGFNSETEEEFNNSYTFLSSLPIAFIHVFTYSDRPDTKAYRIDGKIPIHIRRQRSEILQKLSENKKREFYNKNIGYKANILWEESEKSGKMYGFSDNYLRCVRDYNFHLVNTITNETLQTLDKNKDEFILP